MGRLRVAMIAPPWLNVPARGYGGIENVIGVLVPALMERGVDVELFTLRGSRVKATKKHWLYTKEQIDSIHLPWYDSAPIAIAHIQNALNIIRADGGFDIIHDHNNFFGPLALANSDSTTPPAIHTLHNPRFTTSALGQYGTHIPDNKTMWRQFATADKINFVALSKCLHRTAPKEIKSQMLEPVYNAIDVNQFPLIKKKQDYYVTMARFHPEKGQSTAAKVCSELGVKLKMAGPVAGITTYRKLMNELANPLSNYRTSTDFKYFSDRVFPYLDDKIEYVGEVKGVNKLRFISRARALLLPIRWNEPFGMAVIEALACGTPVVAMRRGAMPELIEHGKTGFLANNEAEFKEYIQRTHEIDPKDCRQAVVERFSGPIMANNYIERYNKAIQTQQKRNKNVSSRRNRTPTATVANS